MSIAGLVLGAYIASQNVAGLHPSSDLDSAINLNHGSNPTYISDLVGSQKNQSTSLKSFLNVKYERGSDTARFTLADDPIPKTVIPYTIVDGTFRSSAIPKEFLIFYSVHKSSAGEMIHMVADTNTNGEINYLLFLVEGESTSYYFTNKGKHFDENKLKQILRSYFKSVSLQN